MSSTEGNRTFGTLVPTGGGDVIYLRREKLLAGRRESCDIRLRFPNVSAHHCELTLREGYWYVRDLGSRNGTKVNGRRVTEKRLNPGDVLSVARHKYEVQYSPVDNGAVGPPSVEEESMDMFGASLLDRAGLDRRSGGGGSRRYDIASDQGGNFKDRNKPV